MKLTVLGATGGVGRHLVRHALADGHEVTAVVRDPARLEQRHDRLAVTRADPLDPAALTPLVAGVDAVLSGIGPAGRRDSGRPASTSARAAVEAMGAAGTRRIVVVSAGPLNRAGTGQGRALRLAAPLLWALFRDVYTDLQRMEAALAGSGLDWTAVRPPKLTDRPGTGRYRSATGAGPAGMTIARADLARAMLDLLVEPTSIGHTVGVSA